MRSPPRLLAPLLLLSLLALAGPAEADEPSPDDVAPPLSFCVGKSATCVTPDFQLSLAQYDLDAKKWESGPRSAGVGYKLLFASDTPYASGFALHATFNLSQATPNYVAPTVTAVLLRYFEAGMTFEFGDGYLKKFVSLGVNVPVDLLSGSTIASRLRAARQAASPPPPPPAPDSTPVPAPPSPASTEPLQGGAQ